MKLESDMLAKIVHQTDYRPEDLRAYADTLISERLIKPPTH